MGDQKICWDNLITNRLIYLFSLIIDAMETRSITCWEIRAIERWAISNPYLHLEYVDINIPIYKVKTYARLKYNLPLEDECLDRESGFFNWNRSVDVRRKILEIHIRKSVDKEIELYRTIRKKEKELKELLGDVVR